MRINEGIHRVLSAVVYYSNTGQSKAVAQYFADRLGYAIFDMYRSTDILFDDLVLVFPVHCQSLPDAVKDFLARIQAKNLALIATYGKMCHGNALYEAQRHYKHNIIAAAYAPAKHTYLDERGFDNFENLEPVLQKIKNPLPIRIPKSYKNLMSNVLKKQRARWGVKIIKTADCNDCGVCSQACSVGAIKNGMTDDKCIRCLKCVYACPVHALEFKLSMPMRIYLKKKKHDDLVIYV